jgi:hypothetical protein
VVYTIIADLRCVDLLEPKLDLLVHLIPSQLRRAAMSRGLKAELHPPTGLAPPLILGLPVLSETKGKIPALSFVEGRPPAFQNPFAEFFSYASLIQR